MRENPYRTAEPQVRVMIADDHATVRQGLCALIGGAANLRIIEEVGDTDSLLARARTLELDVVVMDLSMPRIGGLAAIRLLKAEKPGIAVVVLTRYGDPATVRDAMAAGACGYVLKQSSFFELRQAIEAAARGEEYLDTRLIAARERLSGTGIGTASSRECEVLRRTALGQSNKEISAALSISIRTVEVHKTHGMRKLALRDRTDLVRYASMHGWLLEL